MDKLDKALRHFDVHIYDMDDNEVRVAVNWDDLAPEPRRSKELNELHEARRKVLDEGYHVSEVSRHYGRAYITVRY